MSLRSWRSTVVILLVVACTGRERNTPGAIVDDMDRAITVAAPPERIISLVPSVTDLLVALGTADRLVARTRFDGGAALEHLPDVGGGLDPNIEAVVGLQPDLVIVWPSPDQPLIAQLDAIGIPVYGAGSQTLDDLARHTAQLGRLLHVEPQADSLQLEQTERFDRLATVLEGIEPVTALYVAWHDPPMTTGRGTFVDSILTASASHNVFDDATTDWPRVSLEELLKRDPDVVVLPVRDPTDRAAADWIHRSPGWRELRAVRTGRVMLVETELFSRPGPRVAEAAWQLARMLHPTAFGNDTVE
jgi:iron complex transport system substrate-binding protein